MLATRRTHEFRLQDRQFGAALMLDQMSAHMEMLSGCSRSQSCRASERPSPKFLRTPVLWPDGRRSMPELSHVLGRTLISRAERDSSLVNQRC